MFIDRSRAARKQRLRALVDKPKAPARSAAFTSTLRREPIAETDNGITFPQPFSPISKRSTSRPSTPSIGQLPQLAITRTTRGSRLSCRTASTTSSFSRNKNTPLASQRTVIPIWNKQTAAWDSGPRPAHNFRNHPAAQVLVDRIVAPFGADTIPKESWNVENMHLSQGM